MGPLNNLVISVVVKTAPPETKTLLKKNDQYCFLKLKYGDLYKQTPLSSFFPLASLVGINSLCCVW